ncbi:MAG: Release factor glutamine methyltransferase [Candidatus Omnitrophica bacterium]|nr:Release factor glutamine methyltransferase [Candidatus Omnitrophota bacterium]
MKSKPTPETALALWKETRELYRARRIVSPDAEAERLVRGVAGVDRIEVYAGGRELASGVVRRIRALAKRRAAGVPLAYLLGEQDFMGLSLRVTPAVLIPRPETEQLVEAVLEEIAHLRSVRATQNHEKPLRILDIGTGSGCIAVSLTSACPDCKISAFDVSARALQVARTNALRQGVSGRIVFKQSDVYGAIRSSRARYDLIVSNPPYIATSEHRALPADVRREPKLALTAGRDGLDVIRRIVAGAPERLAPDGALALEIGQEQAAAVRQLIARTKGFQEARVRRDLAGRDRIVIARRR